MKRFAISVLTSLLTLAGAVSCIYEFDITGVEGQSGVLVVEGDIIASGESTFIFSYTKDISNLSAPTTYAFPQRVTVESEDGSEFDAQGRTYGDKCYYVADTKNINTSLKARLVVELDEHSEYVSDWVSFRATPDIDSLTWEIPEDKSALNIYVNTHSADPECRYYKWDFTEDWELTAYYWAFYTYDAAKDTITELPSGVNQYYCWNNDISSDINVHSTEKLTSNVISHRLVTSVPRGSRKIQYIYSIEVNQKAISEEEYKYWEVLLRNSENTGDLFSPQPSELRGNIHLVGSEDEPVIGYVGGCITASKRLFVDCSSKSLYTWDTKECADSLVAQKGWASAYNTKHMIPYQYDKLNGMYIWALKKCADCRTDGTKNKPSFWPTSHK